MDVRLLYPSLYLAAHDLQGKDATLTIMRMDVEEMKTERGSEKKPIVRFAETRAKAEKAGDVSKEKRWVMNKTCALVIAAMHGNEIDNWKGKRITLYATKAQAFGKVVDCIRVRETMPDAEPVTTATSVGG